MSDTPPILTANETAEKIKAPGVAYVDVRCACACVCVASREPFFLRACVRAPLTPFWRNGAVIRHTQAPPQTIYILTTPERPKSLKRRTRRAPSTSRSRSRALRGVSSFWLGLACFPLDCCFSVSRGGGRVAHTI